VTKAPLLPKETRQRVADVGWREGDGLIDKNNTDMLDNFFFGNCMTVTSVITV
jgi:hypothetical protein